MIGDVRNVGTPPTDGFLSSLRWSYRILFPFGIFNFRIRNGFCIVSTSCFVYSLIFFFIQFLVLATNILSFIEISHSRNISGIIQNPLMFYTDIFQSFLWAILGIISSGTMILGRNSFLNYFFQLEKIDKAILRTFSIRIDYQFTGRFAFTMIALALALVLLFSLADSFLNETMTVLFRINYYWNKFPITAIFCVSLLVQMGVWYRFRVLNSSLANLAVFSCPGPRNKQLAVVGEKCFQAKEMLAVTRILREEMIELAVAMAQLFGVFNLIKVATLFIDITVLSYCILDQLFSDNENISIPMVYWNLWFLSNLIVFTNTNASLMKEVIIHASLLY